MEGNVLLRELASRQLWLVTWEQLQRLGFSESAIRHRLAKRELWRVYPGVYAVGHPAMTPKRRRLAAVLACGDDAALSMQSSAVHWRVWERTDPLWHHVSIPTRSGRSGTLPAETQEGARIKIHRPRLLVAGVDTVVFDDIPVTSLARTANDLAGELTPWELRGLLRQMERVHRFDLRGLLESLAEAPPRAFRPARLRRALSYILDDSGMTQTEREALYMDICRRHGIPPMRPQRAVGSTRVDFVDDELRLIVEIDDRGSHDGYVAFADDRKRDRQNANRGYETIRFTVSECRHEPALVAADTIKARERRARLLRLTA